MGGGGRRRRAAGMAPAAAADPSIANLDRINHIVVLLMENRSFDHMLGYLSLAGGRGDIDGLAAGMSNRWKESLYPIHHLARTAFDKDQDPCHEGDCVAEQLGNGNGGFVKNYGRTHRKDPDPGLVMGYYDATDLPVYDHLAREFLVCDRWFCPVPGSTWPNRLYALTGRCDGSKDNRKVPVYNLPSFVRHLDRSKVVWRWYAHDIATLRVADGKYRVGRSGRFFHFDRRTAFNHETFLDHAASGDLARVSWIDPNFADFGSSGSGNDDHPPSDVKAGQELALKVYNAVASSPDWSRTLLIITYDEHGGFFDHVVPPAAADDDPECRSLGPRVPALIVSPWVGRGTVSHTVFDHTSIIRTILLRYCRRPDGSIPDMGARVNGANHLGGLLTETTPRPAPDPLSYRPAVEGIAAWRGEAFKGRLERQTRGEAPGKRPDSAFHEGIASAKKRLRTAGLREGQL
jgi:phospholipase C